VQNCTFIFTTQLNEQVIRRTSPPRGQSTLEKWRSVKGVVTTHFPSNEEQTTLSPKHVYNCSLETG